MKIDIATADRYRTKFHTGIDGLKLGRHTDVEVLSLETAAYPGGRDPTYTTLEITATIKLTARGGFPITAVPYHVCEGCGAVPSLPSTYDALWFVMENHDGDRLIFPDAEDCDEERDRYPVVGWTKTVVDDENSLLCPDCTEAVKATLKSRKRAK